MKLNLGWRYRVFHRRPLSWLPVVIAVAWIVLGVLTREPRLQPTTSCGMDGTYLPLELVSVRVDGQMRALPDLWGTGLRPTISTRIGAEFSFFGAYDGERNQRAFYFEKTPQ